MSNRDNRTGKRGLEKDRQVPSPTKPPLKASRSSASKFVKPDKTSSWVDYKPGGAFYIDESYLRDTYLTDRTST